MVLWASLSRASASAVASTISSVEAITWKMDKEYNNFVEDKFEGNCGFDAFRDESVQAVGPWEQGAVFYQEDESSGIFHSAMEVEDTKFFFFRTESVCASPSVAAGSTAEFFRRCMNEDILNFSTAGIFGGIVEDTFGVEDSFLRSFHGISVQTVQYGLSVRRDEGIQAKIWAPNFKFCRLHFFICSVSFRLKSWTTSQRTSGSFDHALFRRLQPGMRTAFLISVLGLRSLCLKPGRGKELKLHLRAQTMGANTRKSKGFGQPTQQGVYDWITVCDIDYGVIAFAGFQYNGLTVVGATVSGGSTSSKRLVARMALQRWREIRGRCHGVVRCKGEHGGRTLHSASAEGHRPSISISKAWRWIARFAH